MRHRRRLAAALAALLLLTGCTAGQGAEGNGAESSTPVAETPSEPETPAFEWTVEDPADHGLDPAALERFHQALEGHRGGGRCDHPGRGDCGRILRRRL